VPVPWALYRAAILNKKSGVPTIEEMAAPHVALIRSQYISGPCILVGHSFYGFLTIEVARQLRREGIDVEMLLVLDTMILPTPLWYRLKVLSLRRLREAVKRRFGLLVLKAVEVKEMLLLSSRTTYTLDSNLAQVDRLMFTEVPFESLKTMLDQTRANYELRTLESPAILFFSHAEDQRYARSGRTFAQIEKVIRLFAGGFKIVETPGDHLTMFEDPHVQVLARKMNECLAKYSSSSASTYHSGTRAGCPSASPGRLNSYKEQEVLVQRSEQISV
jgi:thioesterase domain-containing protein